MSHLPAMKLDLLQCHDRSSSLTSAKHNEHNADRQWPTSGAIVTEKHASDRTGHVTGKNDNIMVPAQDTSLLQCHAETVHPSADAQQNVELADSPKAALWSACHATVCVDTRRYRAHADTLRLRALIVQTKHYADTSRYRVLRRNKRHLRKTHPTLFRDSYLDEQMD